MVAQPSNVLENNVSETNNDDMEASIVAAIEAPDARRWALVRSSVHHGSVTALESCALAAVLAW